MSKHFPNMYSFDYMLSIHLSIYASIYLSIYLSILSIYPFIYLYMTHNLHLTYKQDMTDSYLI